MGKRAGLLSFVGTPTGSDIDCGLNLFFQITGTVVSAISSMKFVAFSGPWSDEVTGDEENEMNAYIDEIIYGRIFNGMCVTMLFGSFYYAWMALRMRRREERMDVMTLPYGINTPAAFAFIFSVMAPAARAAKAEGMGWKDGITAAWQAGCAANLVAGFIAALAGFSGRLIMRLAPQAALLIPLAGLGMTYLGIAQLLECWKEAALGLVPFLVAILGYFAGVRYHPLPIAVVVMLSGCFMGWIFSDGWPSTGPKVGGTATVVQAAWSKFGFYVPRLMTVDAFAAIPEAALKNISVIMPVAFVGAINTLVSTYSAHEAGDFFDVRETLVIDGCTTMVSALFGSPFGTCVYCGHKALKDSGGRLFHQFVNAFLFCAMALTGQFSMVAALVPPYAISPIILFVGLAINQDAFGALEKRHIPAAIVGLMPMIAEWVVNVIPVACQSDDSVRPLKALGYGSLLSSIMITSFLVFAINANFMQASIWAAAGAFLATFGIIHQPTADLTFKTFTGEVEGEFGTSQCGMMVGYLTVTALCLTLGLLQRFGHARVPQKQELKEDTMTEEEVIMDMVRVRSQNSAWENLESPHAPQCEQDEMSVHLTDTENESSSDKSH